MKNHVKKLEDEISRWPHVSVHEHRFGGHEFLVDKAEVGHAHTGGIVDIPFTRPVRDALLADGLAEEHHWVPNSGWITFRMGSEEDLDHALWLMRLSYLRYALKKASDPRKLFEEESEQLRLSPRFRSYSSRLYPKPQAKFSLSRYRPHVTPTLDSESFNNFPLRRSAKWKT